MIESLLALSTKLFKLLQEIDKIYSARDICLYNVQFIKQTIKSLKINKNTNKNSLEENINQMLSFVKEFVKFYEKDTAQ